jgi:hypothetical protein
MKFILDAIKDEILQKIPGVKTCVSYAGGRNEFEAPVVFLGVGNYGGGTDPATGELALIANVEARVVVDSTIDDAEFCVQNLVCKIANIVHLNSFNLEISPAVITSIARDEFHPEFDVYVCWLIEWQHQFHCGSSVWLESEISPHKIFVNGEAYE